MLTSYTLIGLIVGSAIIGIGATTMILFHIGPYTINEENTVLVGDTISYTIPAPANSPQSMNITGEKFNVTISYPGADPPSEEIASRKYLEKQWVHLQDGQSHILLKNTGPDELIISGVFIRSPDPILLTFDLMVIISGIVIIGFSMGFTIRKPKGF